MQSFGGNHPVKWIPVYRWQASRAIKRHSLERQNLDILHPQLLLNPNLRCDGNGSLPVWCLSVISHTEARLNTRSFAGSSKALAAFAPNNTGALVNQMKAQVSSSSVIPAPTL